MGHHRHSTAMISRAPHSRQRHMRLSTVWVPLALLVIAQAVPGGSGSGTASFRGTLADLGECMVELEECRGHHQHQGNSPEQGRRLSDCGDDGADDATATTVRFLVPDDLCMGGDPDFGYTPETFSYKTNLYEYITKFNNNQTDYKVELAFTQPDRSQWTEEVKTDLGTAVSEGAGLYDAFFVQECDIPTVVEGVTEGQGLRDLSDDIRQVDWWTDVFRKIRSLVSYRGKPRAIPFDADFFSVFMLESLDEFQSGDVPETWENLTALVNKYNGTDLNGDGEPDFGICYPTSSARQKFKQQLLASYTQYNGEKSGWLFDPDDFSIKIQNVELLDKVVYMLKSFFTAPAPTASGVGNRVFKGGADANYLSRCAFFVGHTSKVMYYTTNHSMWPLDLLGSSEVLTDDGLVPCTNLLCPYARESAHDSSVLVNEAPAIYDQWNFGVSAMASEAVAKGALKLANFLQSDEVGWDLMYTSICLDPWRYTYISSDEGQANFFERKPEITGAFMDQKVKLSTEMGLDHDNAAFPLRISESTSYLAELDSHLEECIAGTMTTTQAAAAIRSSFDEITDQQDGVYGDKRWQHNMYRQSLGLAAITDTSAVTLSFFWILGVYVLSGALGALILSYCALRVYRFVESAHKLKQERQEQIANQISEARHSIEDFSSQFCLVKASDFRSFGCFKSHEELRNLGLLLFCDNIKEANLFLSLEDTYCVFFSHQWLGWSAPDPSNVQYALSIKALLDISKRETKKLEQIYVWYDYASIPQKAPMLQKLAIISLPSFASIVDSFVVIAPDATHANTGISCGQDTYLTRAWCRAEIMSHWSRRGTTNMFWATADGLELMAPDGPTKDFLKAVDVFGGELTCCRLGHPNGSRCDKEELMLPMLGLYQDILSKADTTTVKPIFDAIFDVVDDIYPRTFEYVDEHGVTSTKPLFGDLIQAVNVRNEHKRGTTVKLDRPRLT
mmetsp:Transcript_4917/g.10620  ORF Transcript_4917/g.10620 Transcript_4917/m.10620 type:complete len:959 (-) Transcript_4917:851-3727(-)